jgi:aspartyl protease family protein
LGFAVLTWRELTGGDPAMQYVVFFVVAALLLGGVATQFAARFDATADVPAPQVAVAVSPPAREPQQAATGPRTVTVHKDRRGHFQVEASINGRRMDLMVDTGASVVALTRRDAQRIGVHPAPRDFTVEVRTANGIVRAAPARLDAVEIGGIVVRNVTALVVPDEALSENLLGLSFLSRLRRYEYSDGRLVLEN